MSLDLVLAVSSIYLVLAGLGLIIAPEALAGTASFSPVYAADFFRAFGGTLVGIAVLNWMARDSGPSKARSAVVWGNIVGFVLSAIFTIFGLLHGYPPFGWVFVVLDVLVLLGFLMYGMSSGAGVTGTATMPAPKAAASTAGATMVTSAKKASRPAARKATKKSSRRR